MKFGLLGPLVVTTDDGRPLEIRGGKIRALAAALLCRPNRPVTPTALIDALWGPAPPAHAAATLRVYVHHLRQTLGDDRVTHHPTGYELRVHSGERDIDRFRSLVEDARGKPPQAARPLLSAALALWRGDPTSPDAHLLEEERLDALERWFELELDTGRHAESVAELRTLLARHPARENLCALLMRALAGSGRSGDALAAYNETRRWLADEYGLDPGPRLRDVYLSILRDEPPPAPVVTAQSALEEVPRQLPARLAAFTGRFDELARLDSLLDDGIAVAVLTGPAGIGKTTLAVHWAHRIADRFPDGQLYLNLHGFDPVRPPVQPAAALAAMLAGLGVPPARMPVDLDERAGLLRSTLADRRVLVVLDNAREAAQVRPLLPGGAGCVVLVTSRQPLAALVTAGARAVGLPLLGPAECRALLARRIGTARVDAEPAAVDDLVERCGGLPLPLSIVASRAAVRANLPLSTLADGLRHAEKALDGFRDDDASVDLRAVFSWSYRALRVPAARTFRLLALHPGPDATVSAAASLTGLPPVRARACLAELTDANLLHEALPGRYAYHDLMRAYALELTEREDPPADRERAVRRMLDHYLHTAYPAALLVDPNQTPTALDPPAPHVHVDAVSDRPAALAWFASEREVLLAAVARAVYDAPAHAWRLAWSTVVYLDRAGRWQDKLAMLAAALSATQRTGERATEARTLRSLGRTYGRLHRYEPAYEHLEAALRLYDDLGNTGGRAHTLSSFGEVLEYAGRHEEAVTRAAAACELYRRVGDRVGQARALGTVAYQYVLMGRYAQSIPPCRQALELALAAGDRFVRGSVQDTLGVAYRHLGRHPEAVAAFRDALDALTDTGERFYVALVLHHLGDTHAEAGQRAEAHEAWQEALDIFTALGRRDADEVRAKLRMHNN